MCAGALPNAIRQLFEKDFVPTAGFVGTLQLDVPAQCIRNGNGTPDDVRSIEDLAAVVDGVVQQVRLGVTQFAQRTGNDIRCSPTDQLEGNEFSEAGCQFTVGTSSLVQALNQIHQRCNLVIEDILCTHFLSRLFVSKTLALKIANSLHQLSALGKVWAGFLKFFCIDCAQGKHTIQSRWSASRASRFLMCYLKNADCNWLPLHHRITPRPEDFSCAKAGMDPPYTMLAVTAQALAPLENEYPLML